jgi:hypothetical protein
MAVDNIADMAFQYNLAYQTLQSSLRSAENSANTNQTKSEALKTFQDTLTGLLPEDVVCLAAVSVLFGHERLSGRPVRRIHRSGKGYGPGQFLFGIKSITAEG